MPTVAVVDGVKIQFFFGDHPPVHFHVEFAEFKAQIELESLHVIEGRLPPAKLASVRAWAASRKRELRECWDRTSNGDNPGKVA